MDATRLKKFKKLMADISILTGKTPVVYGKAPQDDTQLDYMIEVYHRALKHHDQVDIESAFSDSALRQEIVKGYSLNVDVIEKYVLIHRNRRVGKKKEKIEAIGDFKKAMPLSCVKALGKLGINVGKLAEEKSLN